MEMCNIFRRNVTKDSVSGNLTLFSRYLQILKNWMGGRLLLLPHLLDNRCKLSQGGRGGGSCGLCPLSSANLHLCESNLWIMVEVYILRICDFGLLAMKFLRRSVWGWGIGGAGLKSYFVESLQSFIISPQFLFVSGVKVIINQLQR